ncbi:hypothetical protein LOTGIDRAFT_235481 [Lottia gigantea]|uniref:Uncharacterized protein n=1 Tax=Lottia gigantea TaxID=225164 RepID=V3ZZ09_LOTGI|nr:hypothetical protein LOTGIDRAFT_235481 [Lottia gigantea]ESO86241.1 hypothetical protein LOTGIDRAFT_235481 [Lottia gigantea]
MAADDSQNEDSMNLENRQNQFQLFMEEMDALRKRPWESFGTVSGLVVLSLFVMIMRQEASKSVVDLIAGNSNISIWLQVFIAVSEGMIVSIVISFQSNKENQSYREPLVIFAIAHSIYAMVQGYISIISDTERTSVMAIVLFEPVISACIVFFSTKSSMSVTSNVAISVTCLSAAMIVFPMHFLFGINRSVCLAILYGICVSARNVCCHHVNKEHSAVIVVRKRVIPAIFISTIFSIPACLCFYFGAKWILPAIYYVCAVAGSVGTVVILTRIINNFSVISISLFNLWVYIGYILLYSLGIRHDMVFFCLSLVTLLISQLIYFIDRGGKNSGSTLCFKLVSTEELQTRLLFLLFISTVGTLILYALTPSFSQRDLKTLKFVGLDGVFRRLLQIKD